MMVGSHAWLSVGDQSTTDPDRRRAANFAALGTASQDCAGLGVARQNRAGLRPRPANQQVAEQLGIWPQTVGKWRGRFVRQRREGLSDEPRPGRPRTITDEQVEQVITKTLEEPPPGRTRTGRPGRWPGRPG